MRDSWIDIISLNARVIRSTSARDLPFTAALIIEVDAWLIEQPWPLVRMSRTVSPSSSSSR
jgi:hypothetical protein